MFFDPVGEGIESGDANQEIGVPGIDLSRGVGTFVALGMVTYWPPEVVGRLKGEWCVPYITDATVLYEKVDCCLMCWFKDSSQLLK